MGGTQHAKFRPPGAVRTGGKHLMKYKLHHCALICRSYDEAIDFFVNKLGMELLRQSESKRRGGMKLEIGVDGVYLFEVFAVPTITPVEAPETTVGHNHVAFGVSDVSEALAWLEGRGVRVTERKYDALAERDYGFFYGPDGIKFELYQTED